MKALCAPCQPKLVRAYGPLSPRAQITTPMKPSQTTKCYRSSANHQVNRSHNFDQLTAARWHGPTWITPWRKRIGGPQLAKKGRHTRGPLVNDALKPLLREPHIHPWLLASHPLLTLSPRNSMVIHTNSHCELCSTCRRNCSSHAYHTHCSVPARHRSRSRPTTKIASRATVLIVADPSHTTPIPRSKPSPQEAK